MSNFYDNYKTSEHSINVLLVTACSSTASLIIAALLWYFNLLPPDLSAVTGFILIIIPVIVFIASLKNIEFHIAYYRSIADKIMGKIDCHKILKQFARQYHLKKWRHHIEDVMVDGRWKFHIDSRYVHHLIEQRDYLLSNIYQEYQGLLATCKEKLIIGQANIENCNTELKLANDMKKIAEDALADAKTPGERYQQKQTKIQAMQTICRLEQAKNVAIQQVKILQQTIQDLINEYRHIADNIDAIYQARYSQYTAIAIKKINLVNGLKYQITNMPASSINAKFTKEKK